VGYSLSYQGERARPYMQKLKIYKSTGIIYSIFKSMPVQNHARLTVYDVLAKPTLAYESEAWAIEN
jgi:hypothetical protein